MTRTGVPQSFTAYAAIAERHWDLRVYTPAPRQFAVAFTDATERVDAERRLEESIRRWKDAQAVAKIGNWEFDVATGQIWGSEEAFRIYGIPFEPEHNPEQQLPLDDIEACIPEAERVHGALLELITKESPYDLEYEVIRRDNGASQLIHSQARLLRAPDGTPIKVTGTIHDVTERRRRDQALRESEQKYRTLVENAMLGVVIAQSNPVRILFANAAMEDMTGYTPAELLALRPEQIVALVDPEDRARYFDNFQRRFDDQPVSTVNEYRFVTSAGETRHVHTHSKLIEFAGEPATLTMFSDVTAIKEAEKEHRRLEAQLQQAQRLESVGRLAGGVAHDFNNLITSITGNVALAMSGRPIDDDLREALTEIAHAATSAAELTRQLLAFSRKQLMSPRVLDLNAAVERARRMIVRLIGEDVRLETKLATGLGRVKADPGQISQVLVNLAVNARDAMPDGGRLTIATSEISLDGGELGEGGELPPGPYVALEVTDTGAGMDDETRAKVFDPFFTTKPKDQGTGLGLATVYGIVKQHGGHIEVRSAPSEGASFRLLFPRVADEAEPLVAASEPATVPRGSETVLLVEDDPAVRRVASRALRRQGYTVIEAEDGPHALARCEQDDLVPDLLLTDIVMPHMNGRQLAETLRERHPELLVLFTSGYTEDVIAHHGVLDKGVNFIGKPYTPRSLAHKVREILDGPAR